MSRARGGSRPIEASGGGESRNAVARSPVSSRINALTPSASARSWIGASSSKSSPARVRRTVLAALGRAVLERHRHHVLALGREQVLVAPRGGILLDALPQRSGDHRRSGLAVDRDDEVARARHLAADQELLLLSVRELHHHAAARRVEPYLLGVVLVELAHASRARRARAPARRPASSRRQSRSAGADASGPGRRRSSRWPPPRPSPTRPLRLCRRPWYVRTSSVTRSPAWSSSRTTSSRSTPSTRLASFSRSSLPGCSRS